MSWLVTVLHSITESPPSRNTSGVTASAHIRTRGGCSYGWEEGLFLCRSAAPVRKGARVYGICGGGSYGREGGQVLGGGPAWVRKGASMYRICGGCSYGREEGLFLCRSTASVRTGRARIRTRGGCSYGREEGCTFVGAPPRCEPRGHPSPVIGASYGVHCSKSPAGRVQSGFQ